VECLPADKPWDVVSVICDTPESWALAWRRGPVCVRVYARVLVPQNLYIHIHTYTNTLLPRTSHIYLCCITLYLALALASRSSKLAATAVSCTSSPPLASKPPDTPRTFNPYPNNPSHARSSPPRSIKPSTVATPPPSAASSHVTDHPRHCTHLSAAMPLSPSRGGIAGRGSLRSPFTSHQTLSHCERTAESSPALLLPFHPMAI